MDAMDTVYSDFQLTQRNDLEVWNHKYLEGPYQSKINPTAKLRQTDYPAWGYDVTYTNSLTATTF